MLAVADVAGDRPDSPVVAVDEYVPEPFAYKLRLLSDVALPLNLIRVKSKAPATDTRVENFKTRSVYDAGMLLKSIVETVPVAVYEPINLNVVATMLPSIHIM